MLSDRIEELVVEKDYPNIGLGSFEAWKTNKTVEKWATARAFELDVEELDDVKTSLGVVEDEECYFDTWLTKSNPPGGEDARIVKLKDFFLAKILGDTDFQEAFASLFKMKQTLVEEPSDAKVCIILADVEINDKPKLMISVSGTSYEENMAMHMALAKAIDEFEYGDDEEEDPTLRIDRNDVILCEFANLHIRENLYQYNSLLAERELSERLEPMQFQKTCAELPLFARMFKHQVHDNAHLKVNAVANLMIRESTNSRRKGILAVVKNEKRDKSYFKIDLVKCCSHCSSIKEPMTDLLMYGQLAVSGKLVQKMDASPMLTRKACQDMRLSRRRNACTSLDGFVGQELSIWEDYNPPGCVKEAKNGKEHEFDEKAKGEAVVVEL